MLYCLNEITFVANKSTGLLNKQSNYFNFFFEFNNTRGKREIKFCPNFKEKMIQFKRLYLTPDY